MKKLYSLMLAIFIAMTVNPYRVFAIPSLTLPFPEGEKWRCDQGNYDDPQGSTNITHKSSNSMAYAWDFNVVDGEDNGKPIFAPANGVIANIYYNKGAFGNVVVINYGDGSYGKFAHVLSSIPVQIGQNVYGGVTVIGYVGGTGGWSPHIHYETQNSSAYNGQSIRSTFVDVPGNGIPKEDNYYLRGGLAMFNDSEGWHDLDHNYPSSPFFDAYDDNGGYNVLGAPWANNQAGPNTRYVHPWPSDGSYNPPLQVQDFLTNNGIWSMIVYNSDRQQAFVVSDQIAEYWTSNSGYSIFGPPLENEEKKQVNGVFVRGQNFKTGKTIYYQDDGVCRVITTDKVSSAVSHGYGNVGPSMVSIATRPVADIQPLRGAPATYNYRDFKLGLFVPGTLNGPYVETWPARRGFPFSSGLYAASWPEISWPNYARNPGDRCMVGSVTGTNCACDLYSAHLTPAHEGLRFPIKQGQRYRVEFEARIPQNSSLSQRNLIVALTKPNVCTTTSEWPLDTNLVHFGSRQQFTLTKEWQRFSYEFTATGTEKNATIRFFFGDQNGEIVLDNLYFDLIGETGQKLDLMVKANQTWQWTYDTNGLSYSGNNYCNFSATYPAQHPEAALGLKTTSLSSLNFQPYMDGTSQIVCYLDLPASIPYLDPKLSQITFYWGQNPSNCYWVSTSQDLFGANLLATPSGSPYFVWIKANLPQTSTAQKTGQPNPSQITYFEVKLTLNNMSYSFSSGHLYELYLIGY